MTDEEKKKLNEKLAKWAGLVSFTDFIGNVYEYADKLYKKPPDFTDSLDACIKWLVPRLTGWTLAKHRDEAEYKASVLIGDSVRDKISPVTYAETPALALCLAVEKLIDEKKD